jgi:hypothetical protein
MATDWPHDPDSDEGSEGMRKYGQAILAKKIDEDEDFPLRIDEFVEEFGDDPVRLNYETIVSVREILDHVDQEEFEDFPSFHGAVGDAMRAEGLWEFQPEASDRS